MGSHAENEKEKQSVKVTQILLDIGLAFDIENKPRPSAVFFSSDRVQEIQEYFRSLDLPNEEIERVADRNGVKWCGVRLMSAEPVPHDQVWLFNKVGSRIGVFQIGEANDSARSI